jgi:Family of unknown function (DUF6454)
MLAALVLLQTISLQSNTHHVQGIVVEGSRLWVTSVDVPNERGLLMEFHLPDGKPVRSIELQEGSRYHPGGVSADATSLWIPVAEYTRTGTSVIQKRNKTTLALEADFSVADHIGCLAVTGDTIIGGNWDAREIYVWDHSGKLIRKVANPVANAFQDMKVVNGQLVASGLLADKSGAIDWLELPSFRPLRRLTVGSTDRGLAFTHEGMAIADGKLWLLPEDSPSRLFIFELPK